MWKLMEKGTSNYSQDRIRTRGPHLQHPLLAGNRTTQQSPCPKLQESDVLNGREPYHWPDPLC